jgi:hypothetical protein
MILNGEQPLRDFADAELRGAWPSLSYELSAWAQRAWGRTLLAEAYLAAGALAVAAGLVFLLALDLSRRWLVSLAAAACVIASAPKLYNYEKVLVLAAAALLIRMWLVKPSMFRMVMLAVATAVAILFRHDFGVYVGAAAAAAIVARDGRPLRVPVRRLAIYAGLVIALLLPSIIWVQTYAGLGTYLSSSLESVRGESVRTGNQPAPRFDLSAGFGLANAVAATYYTFWAGSLVAIAAIAVRHGRGQGLDRVTRATGVALCVVAVLANLFFLRNNLPARFGDAVVPIALLAAWTSSVLPFASRAVLLVMLMGLFSTGGVAQELRIGGLSNSFEAARQRFEIAHAELQALPPRMWAEHQIAEDDNGTLLVARYVAQCTDRTDRVLLATYAPEVLVLASRLFAAGQGTFGLNFYRREAQQREAVERLKRQSAPIVLGSADDFKGEFIEEYPYVYEYVAAHYRDAGVIAVEGKPRFRVLVDNRRQPVRSDPYFHLPCFL